MTLLPAHTTKVLLCVRTRFIGITVAALVLTASAYADAIPAAPPTPCAVSVCFTPGNSPPANEENVLLNGMGKQQGNPVFGTTNHTHTTVRYFSTTDTLTGTGGQADIDALDGLLNNISITIPANSPGCAFALGCSFQDLIINPFKEAVNFGANITVVTKQGTFHDDNFGSDHGNNFLTITVGPGNAIFSVTIDSAAGFQDLKQTRISGPYAEITPEPSTMLLVGSGVLLLAQGLRRKLM